MVKDKERSSENLKEIDLRYHRLFETTQDGIILLDGDTGEINDVNPSFLKLLELNRKDIMGKYLWEIGLFKSIEEGKTAYKEIKNNNYIRYDDLPIKTKKGELKDVEFVSNAYPVDQNLIIQCNLRDISDRKRAENARVQIEDKFCSLVEQSSDGIVIINQNGEIVEWNHGQEKITGISVKNVIGRRVWDIQYQMTPEELKSPELLREIKKNFRSYLVPRKSKLLIGKFDATIVHTDGKRRELQSTIFQFESDTALFAGITSQDVTERIQHQRELEAIFSISAAMRVANSLDEMLPLLLDKTLEVMSSTQGSIWLYNPNTNSLEITVSRGWNITEEHQIPPEKPNEGINGLVFATEEPYISKELHQDLHLPERIRQEVPPGIGGATIPIRAGDNVVGTLNVNAFLPHEMTSSDVRFLTTLSEIAGHAIHRMQQHEKILVSAQHLAALHSVDVSINTTSDLSVTLNVLLDQVISLLKVSAADFLLLNPYTLTLEYASGRGFNTKEIVKRQLRLGEGYAGRAALTRKTLNVPNLQLVGPEYLRKDLLAGEDFVSYYGVPLIAKNKVIGVLDLYSRIPLAPDNEWLEFMEALASQAAIAIWGSTLFNDLQRTNLELLQAYDKTIEGWSLAMDYRDHETEGHTQRVTDLTVKLAQKFNLKDEEIAQIRRGALLHDMGKMGIPDSVLLKPGPLTDEEWEIMRQHPRIAFNMLSPIEFLRPALDIPYCHHEKWDGTGYPRGLKGEQIPFAARLFAVVDVWDALRSDRPYRKAWSEEKVFEYIRSLSGIHFDPKVVEPFIQMMQEIEH